MHQFEFDPRKSAANLAKHGIDFLDAQEIWMDERRLEIDARSLGEPRTQVLGRGHRPRVADPDHLRAQGAPRREEPL
jgi:uncharacterized DUF497 family protein